MIDTLVTFFLSLYTVMEFTASRHGPIRTSKTAADDSYSDDMMP